MSARSYTRRQLMMGIGRPYAEIEYLESTGSQYIDTGYYPNVNSKVRADWMPTEITSNGYFGVRELTSRFCCTTFNSGTMFAFAMSYMGWPSNRFSLSVGSRYDCVAKNGEYSCNGTQYTSSRLSSFTTSNPFLLCRYNIGSAGGNSWFNSKMRIYALQIWENDALIHDFIPVRVGNVGYMYDRVSGQLFGNAGTGNFILGPDK